MEKLTVYELAESSCGKITKGCPDDEINGIVIDSRQAKEGLMFTAIDGENNDGHKYIESAADSGCRCFMVDKGRTPDIEGINVIEVEETSKALGKIAASYRKKFDIPFVGITGSVGKTTTRDMVYAVLSAKMKTLKNEKNFNNHFGVPLTLFNLEKCHECAVIEMGMSGFGEIEYLADIVKPDIAVISNIGLSHVENLGSQEGIFKAKMEITTGFGEGNTLIVNGDDKFLGKLKDEEHEYGLVTFGFGNDNDIYCIDYIINDDSIEFVCNVYGNEEKIYIPTVGKHNILNAMAAIAAGYKLGLDMDTIRKGLENFSATAMRLDIEKYGEFTVINDAYNASPDSMKAALDILGRYRKRRIAVLGDMLEMGEHAEYGHRTVGASCPGNADILITAGKDSKFINEEAEKNGFSKSNSHHFESKKDAEEFLDDILEDGDVVLCKASRGMKFEDFVAVAKEKSEKNR